jgi:hypothetical protein
MDYTISNDGHKLYKAYCECGKDRGYKRKHQLYKKCSSCAALITIRVYGNPMQGKKHENKVQFRKNTFKNVDYEDVKIGYSCTGNKYIKYRQTCPSCNFDVGYRRQVDANRTCKKCRDNEITLNTPEQKRIRASMKANLVSRLKNRLLNKNKKSTFDILGYSVDQLKILLESKFQPGMSWNNYGEWEIDHITPDSWFEYNSMEDVGFKNSWALDNLQPLWKEDNASKGNRYEG